MLAGFEGLKLDPNRASRPSKQDNMLWDEVNTKVWGRGDSASQHNKDLSAPTVWFADWAERQRLRERNVTDEHMRNVLSYMKALWLCPELALE